MKVIVDNASLLNIPFVGKGVFFVKEIFVVDDNITNLTVAKNVLKDQYRIRTIPSAAKMFEILDKITPDLILLDIEMPEMNGFEALTILKNNKKNKDIPVIFLTGLNDQNVEARGFQMGVVDFINKPFSEPVLQNRIKTHLEIDEIIKERTAMLHQKSIHLQNLQDAIIHTMAEMVEKRDKNTGGHIERTTSYITVIVEEMMANGPYQDELRRENIDRLISSARLHDVGKIAISDTVLNKPGNLTDEEMEIMKTHCEEGVAIIDNLISRTEKDGADEAFLNNARLIIGSHHERWDGKGYPKGLSGENIPLQGRIMAIVDVYDALISVRPYKKAFSSDEAVKIIMKNTGSQFDPRIAETFFKVKDRLEAVER